MGFFRTRAELMIFEAFEKFENQIETHSFISVFRKHEEKQRTRSVSKFLDPLIYFFRILISVDLDKKKQKVYYDPFIELFRKRTDPRTQILKILNKISKKNGPSNPNFEILKKKIVLFISKIWVLRSQFFETFVRLKFRAQLFVLILKKRKKKTIEPKF